MSKKLSFSIAVNLLTENFKKRANDVKNSLRSIQMQVITFAAALGVGGLGLAGLVSRMKDVARETSRALTALKNVSGGAGLFADNLRFLNNLAKQYGVEINTLVFNFAKFKAAGDSVGMSLIDQRKIFEATSRAAVAYGMSAEDTNLTFLAITQMMSKGKISSEELRRQLGERLPIAMAAMAKAAGVPINKLDDLLKKGKLLSHEVLPKFADALNEMIPNVDTDNLETSLNRLSNAFTKFTQSAGVAEKYKVLIDGLASMIEKAGNNIKNIVLMVVAAIVFAVTNGVTKVWRSYDATGKQIIASAEAANAKMLAATAARTEAEIALDKARSAAFFATEKQRMQAVKDVAKAELAVKRAVAAETKAIEASKLADAKAAAIKTNGVWATTWAAIKGTALKAGAAIKSMWNTFAPAIIISAIVATIGYFKNIRDEANRIRNIFSEYKKEASNIGNTQEIKILQAQLSIMNDKTKSQKDINSAQAELRKMLGLEKGDQRDLNALVAERIKLLKATAQADYYSHKAVSSEDRIKELSKSIGLTEDEAKSIANARTDAGMFDSKYLDKINDVYKKKGYTDSLDGAEIDKAIFEIIQNIEVLNDANKELGEALKIANKQKQITPITTGDDTKPDKTEDKRLEALRKLDEADRQRQLDKLAFDNEMRQRSIDNMEDSFLKEFAQLKLNNDRELQEIEDYRKKMSKAQLNEVKNQYVAKKGNTKGFEVYLKTVNLSEVLPDELKPENIEKQVNELTEAANATLQKGLSTLNKEVDTFRNEERLRFASHLDQELYEIKVYYEKRLQLAKGDATLTKQLLENRNKETEAAVLQSIGKQLEFEMQYNQKVHDLTSDRYLFDTDKRKASIQQQIADQQKIFNNLDKQSFNDPNNKDLANQFKSALVELKKLKKEGKDLEKNEFFLKVGEATGVFTSLRGALDDFGISFSDNVNKALDGVGQMLDGLASIDVTNPFSIASGSIEALGGLAKTFSGIFGGGGFQISEATYERYNVLMETMDKLIDKQKELISSMSGKEAVDASKQAQALIKNQIDETKNLGRQWMDVRTSGNHSKGYRIVERLNPFRNKLADMGIDLDSLGGRAQGIYDLPVETLEKLRENLEIWNALGEETRNYIESIIDAQERLEELKELEREALTGVSFDSLKDSFLDTLMDMDSSAKDFAESFGSYLQKAILKTMLDEQFAGRLRDWYNKFATYNEDGEIDSWEYNDLQSDWNGITNDALSARDKLKDIFGWTSDGSHSQDSSKGYSVSMDQDTGGAILGRVTGLHETGIMMREILSGISLNSNNVYSQTVSINDELKKQTVILDEIRQIQSKTFFEIEEMNESIKDQSDKLDNIDKNTKNL